MVETARQLTNAGLDAGRTLNTALAAAMSNASPEEFNRIRRVIGGVMGTLAIELLNPLFREHPSIKPEEYYLPE